ncbi:ADP-heptose--LPS heptosyltransferase [Clostridium felsineum]|uniref:ADP-heptose--LPS heptosyltransferase n=1 Tax=Clostridium felsineum TaxID=36839 RepID=UPI00214D325B|nr:ADP-heptose--LPS heptosyltransferase [Clostridium felsineum]MCR3757800.1 ADP-heptose--LPS heptosyltransferase [Clostridium felsineum]
MNSVYIDEIYLSIDKLEKEGKLLQKFIVLFGTNKPSENAINHLKRKNIKVAAIMDNYSKDIEEFLGIKIYKPEQLLSNFKNNACILIASKYYDEMCAQLEAMGYKRDIHIFKILDYNRQLDLDKEFDKARESVISGYSLFEVLQKKYGSNTTIFVCPYKGLGDIYISCSYLNEYIRKNNISNYVITVVGNSYARIAHMFNIKDVKVITQEESDNIVNLSRMIEAKDIKLKVLAYNNKFIYTDVLGNFQNNEKFNWGMLFKSFVMGIDDKAIKTEIRPIYREEYIVKLFKDKNLKKGKTVIISKSANTIVGIKEDLWEEIVEILIQNEYTVCTNIAGTNDKPIKKTIPLDFSLEDAIGVIEYGGFFIGIRSGLCDLISSAKAKKIIIYPDKKSMFYSIEKMGLSDDVIEVLSSNCLSKIAQLM